jgi:hypothetical protein
MVEVQVRAARLASSLVADSTFLRFKRGKVGECRRSRWAQESAMRQRCPACRKPTMGLTMARRSEG